MKETERVAQSHLNKLSKKQISDEYFEEDDIKKDNQVYYISKNKESNEFNEYNTSQNHESNKCYTSQNNESSEYNTSKNQESNEYFEQDDIKDEEAKSELSSYLEVSAELKVEDLTESLNTLNAIGIDFSTSSEEYSALVLPQENCSGTYVCSVNSCTFFTNSLNEDHTSVHFEKYHPQVDAAERKFIQL